MPCVIGGYAHPQCDPHKYMISPYLIEQLRTAVYPLGVGHQKMQQPEFGRTQHYFITVGGYAMSSRVQVQSTDLDHIVGCFGERRRSTALILASISRGEKGLVM